MYFLQEFGHPEREIPPPEKIDASTISGSEARARFLTALSFTLFFVVASGTILFSFSSVWLRLSGDVNRRIIYFSAVFFFTCIILVLAYTIAPRLLVDTIGRNVFEGTIGKHPGDGYLFTILICLIHIAVFVGAVAVAFIGTAVCTLIPDSQENITKGSSDYGRQLNQAAFLLADQVKWLKYYLVVAAALVLASLANMYLWSVWPASYYRDAAAAKNYMNVALAPIIFFAGLYVAILAAIFLPIAFRLYRAGQNLGENSV